MAQGGRLRAECEGRRKTMGKKDKGSKKAKKLVKKAKEDGKKETKKSNIEVDRSDVKPPSPFSS
jgi:hypothetical protein